MKKGSITVFLSLLLGIVLSLVCTSIYSAKIAASRTMTVSAMDQSLYSVFAEYDTDVLENYGLFFLDGGYGKSQFQPGSLYKRAKSYAAAVLEPGKNSILAGNSLLNIQIKNGGISGYALASDGNGRLLKSQAIAYMQDTLLEQGVQSLLSKLQNQQQQEAGNNQSGNVQAGEQAITDYDAVKQQAEEEQERKKQETDSSQGEEQEVNTTEVPLDFVNPIEVIKQIKKLGILGVVVPGGVVSSKSVEVTSLPSHRSLAQGMGEYSLDMDIDSVTSNLMFQEYLLDMCGNYTGTPAGGLDYQIEYILQGKGSDKENLEGVVKQLLLIREASNLAYLYQDGAKREAVNTMAQIICAAIGLPVVAPAVQLALLACWAYGESILDVRELLDGGKIPLIKSTQSWQLSLENLASIAEHLDQDRKSTENGMNYSEYLRLLLAKENKTEIAQRTMDIVENTIRVKYARPEFSIDACLVYAEVFLNVQAESKRNYEIVRGYGYDM